MALVPLPTKIPRFVRLPGPMVRFIAIEQVILMHLAHIFPNFTCQGAGFSESYVTARWRSTKRPKIWCARSKAR